MREPLTLALERLLKGGDPDQMRSAVNDFLIAYADARTSNLYDDAEEDARCRSLRPYIARGLIRYPFTDDGLPIYPGMLVRRPFGDSSRVENVTLYPARSPFPCELGFADDQVYRGPIKGFRIAAPKSRGQAGKGGGNER